MPRAGTNSNADTRESPPPDESVAAFERAAEVFGILSSVPRLRIVRALCEREMSVAELVEFVELAQPNTSQQLGLLYRAGIVTRRRQGAQVYYSAHPRSRAFVCTAVESLMV